MPGREGEVDDDHAPNRNSAAESSSPKNLLLVAVRRGHDAQPTAHRGQMDALLERLTPG